MKRVLLLVLMLLSFSAYSQTVHFMLFAATNDADLGTAAENVKKYFTYTFVPSLRNNSGMSVSANYYCGSDFSKSKLESVLGNLYSNSNDVIIFYFYGHGFNDCRPACPNPNNYPTITLGTNEGPINPRMKSELDIFNTLKAKPHKLLITIAECCNRCMGGSCTPMSIIVPNPAVDLSAQKIRQLFSATGDYIVSSSSKGEYSFSGNMGFFTSGFKNALEEELSSTRSGYPSWTSIFSNAASKTTAMASKHDFEGGKCVQHPQWKKETTSPSSTIENLPSLYDNGCEYVDLGLPSGTLWASCNVGASNPWDYGYYFAWGETKSKLDYSWSTYIYCKRHSTKIIKYCSDDNISELQSVDDVATILLGNNWCMPTKTQWDELMCKCIWIWSKRGYIIKSKNNGNQIVLPLAGYKIGKTLYYDGSMANYWSSSLDTRGRDCAWILTFGDGISQKIINDLRCRGHSVRPVRNIN